MDITMASKGTDCLSNLPAELLIEIISRLPPKYLLDLKHTSSFFKYFLHTHGAAICNGAIRSIYAEDARLLQTTLKSGWLVAGDEVLRAHHSFYYTYSRHHPLSFRHWGRPYYDRFFAKKEGQRNIFLSLAEPGPQFLYFLQQKMLWICDSNRVLPTRPGNEYGFLVSITAFERFMAKMHGSVRRGERLDRDFLQKFTFPRELIWYYKVEKK